MYGACGLSSVERPNALPDSRGEIQDAAPTAVRTMPNCLIALSRFMRGPYRLTLPRVREIQTTDYHTAGEPFRIVVEGAPEIPGATVRDRREAAAASADVDAVRRLLCNEPRGHADMYGCFVVPPDDDGADLGVLFWHKDGYSTACGHGTIALGRWAVESGRVEAAPSGTTEVTIDVPSGRVVAIVRENDVTFRNVPSYVIARGVEAGGVRVDVSYGGAIYASVAAADLGLSVRPEDLSDLISAGPAVKGTPQGTGLAPPSSHGRPSGNFGPDGH